MAKMFYSAEEAAKRLRKTEDELKEMVRAGSLREFRDGATVNYKVADVEAMAGSEPSDSASASASGEIVLEPVDDSSIELSPAGSDILSLEEVDSGDTSASTAMGKEDTATRLKSDSVVPSVGVNVFDDEELDEAVDPLAQTAVTDMGGLGVDGVGSGSGILDLTKESDDTSLGAELLDEIYSGEEEESAVEMAEDTRAGLDDAVTEEDTVAEEGQFEAGAVAVAPQAEGLTPQVRAAQFVEAAPDALSTSLTALMVVAVVVLWFAGLAGASMVRGVFPSLLKGVYANLPYYSGGALGVALMAGGITFLLARRSSK